VSAPTVLVEHDAGVTTLTLNRPERKNGITKASVEAAVAAVEQIAAAADTRVLVVTGAGDAFCSGMDLSESVLPDELGFMRRVGHLCTLLHELPLPTIAKVRGAAVGFGCNFALCCDLVIAAEDAVFGEVFADRGLAVDGAGSWTLPRLIGLHRAKELLFFARSLTGLEAADLGLINRAVPGDALDAFVAEWAQTLATGPRRALSTIKAELNASFESSFVAAVEREAQAQSLALRSPEVREGMKAFLEKRKPNFP
jgi:2-(1,2-epoxy-1,2-dihydrophenyl)acetyl-CoA isomerase